MYLNFKIVYRYQLSPKTKRSVVLSRNDKLLDEDNNNNKVFNSNDKKSKNIINQSNYDLKTDIKKEKVKNNKEAFLYKTYNIQNEKVKNETLLNKLRYFIKTNNFNQFKEKFKYRNFNVLEIKDSEGLTLLNLASKCNIYDICIFLIEEGADINTQDNILNCPLHYALFNNNYKLSDYLIYKKADQNNVNIKGLNPWQYS